MATCASSPQPCTTCFNEVGARMLRKWKPAETVSLAASMSFNEAGARMLRK